MLFTSLERTLLISSNPLPEFSVTTWIMAIAGFLLFFGVSSYIFRRLRASSKEEPFLGPHAILSQVRDLRDSGALSEEEFRKIKLIMADKIAGEENDARQEEQ